MQKIVSFYVQATKASGLGHLHRSISLIKKFKNIGYKVILFGEIDNDAIKILQKKNIDKFLDTPRNGLLIIDAITIELAFKKKLSNYNHIFLVSPIFSDIDFPTHIFSRSTSVLASKHNKKNKKVIYDHNFSFATINGLKRRASINYKKIKVGICISGSIDYCDIENLINVSISTKNVDSVKVLSKFERSKTINNEKNIIFERSVDNIWEYFQDIDVFISGDGLMIFESMAQAIPTLSLFRKSYYNKNKFFYDEGMCLAVDSTYQVDKKVNAFLSDSNMLEKHRNKLFSANFSQKEDVLFNCLKETYEAVGT